MDFDVFVVGTGQAGIPLATRLAAAGKRVAIAERGNVGGTCMNYGCTPTKTMIASARAAHVARTAARLGVHTGEVRVDFAAVVARKDAMVRRWTESAAKRLQSGGDRLKVLQGQARFVGERELEVTGTRYRADTVILNVGARPVAPHIPGLDRVAWLDNHRAMDLRELPHHLIVIGGGYIGCELAQMFRRFGAEVTILGQAPHLLEHADPEISEAIEGVFRDEGVRLELGAKIERVDAIDGGEIRVSLSSERQITGSHLLVATGRRPNTDDLGCDAAGVALDGKGYVIVDDHHATRAPGIYAVGDATPQPQFTHTSWDDHRILFDHLLGREGRSRSSRLIPYAVFTDPQVAGVGVTEAEAKACGLRYEVATMSFGSVARALEIDEPAGFMKVLIDPATERVLGATLVGAEAGELVHVFVALMQAGAPARAIVDAEFVHPTFAEGLQTLVTRLDRYALH
jgi:pyruvate/2-oxoglutarate dehydrogenase complex dihydrolipoamide dehydrogenase (E3) component